jgi:hypothetical protein
MIFKAEAMGLVIEAACACMKYSLVRHSAITALLVAQALLRARSCPLGHFEFCLFI